MQNTVIIDKKGDFYWNKGEMTIILNASIAKIRGVYASISILTLHSKLKANQNLWSAISHYIFVYKGLHNDYIIFQIF